MLGGLYGDLPPPSSTSTASSSAGGGGGDDERSTSSWLSSAKMMAPPALRKPAATLLAPPQPLLRNQQQSLHKPKPSNPSPQSVRTVVTASVLLPTDKDDVVVVRSSAPSQPALVGVTSSVMEEYDPARPNDYEEYRKERKRKVAEEEMKREMERRRREEEERELELEREREKEREANQRDRDRELNISGEEAWRRRAAMSSGSSSGMGSSSSGKARSPSPPSNGDGFSIVKSGNSGLAIGAGGQMTAAQKMMAKMGWKEGQGLGKQEQGITTPLIAKKTDRRAGVIVNASETSKKPKSVSFNGPPTCVVLLRNMVGPGEVDDELESEVADECTKYGSVVRVLIFEITEPGFPDDEAVRIYIKFARSEDATKALIELEGRYFGGRLVKATFFDEDKFDRNQLAPMPGEIPGYF